MCKGVWWGVLVTDRGCVSGQYSSCFKLQISSENPLTRCMKCGAVVKDTDSVLDAVRIGQEALDKATRLQFSGLSVLSACLSKLMKLLLLTDPPKAIQLTTRLISILMSIRVLPSSHPLLALSRLHTTLLITNYRSPFDPGTIELDSPQIQMSCGNKSSLAEAQERLDEAIRSAMRTCNALNQVLTYGHPIRGLATAELGKLLSVDEPSPGHLVEGALSPTSSSSSALPAISLPPCRKKATASCPPSGPERLRLAYETLVCARGELMVGFGGGKNEGGKVGNEVRRLLIDVERELAVWKDGIRNTIASLPQGRNK